MLVPSPCFLNDPPGYEGGFEMEALQALVRSLAVGRLRLRASGHCPHVSAPEEIAAVLWQHAGWRGNS
jgi:hypothetical protein